MIDVEFCPCPMCMGTLEPPEPSEEEFEEWLAQQTPNREIDIIEESFVGST